MPSPGSRSFVTRVGLFPHGQSDRPSVATGVGMTATASAAGPDQPDSLDPELAHAHLDQFSDPASIFERSSTATLPGVQIRGAGPADDPQSEGRHQHLPRDHPGPGGPAGWRLHHRRGDHRLRRQPDQVRPPAAAPGSPSSRAGAARRGPAYYYIFDVLWTDGRDVRPLPLRDRKRILRDLLDFTGPLRFTEHEDTDGEAYFRQACASGWEGLIAKRADAPYRGGRTRDWLKFKCEARPGIRHRWLHRPARDPHRVRCAAAGLLRPRSQARLCRQGRHRLHQRTLDSLHARLAGLEQDRPPFDRGKLPRSGVHWVQPRLVAEVGFSEWTTAGELRHPRFQGLRDGKDPADVVREMPQDNTR